jgi:hypothetical protein
MTTDLRIIFKYIFRTVKAMTRTGMNLFRVSTNDKL